MHIKQNLVFRHEVTSRAPQTRQGMGLGAYVLLGVALASCTSGPSPATAPSGIASTTVITIEPARSVTPASSPAPIASTLVAPSNEIPGLEVLLVAKPERVTPRRARLAAIRPFRWVTDGPTLTTTSKDVAADDLWGEVVVAQSNPKDTRIVMVAKGIALAPLVETSTLRRVPYTSTALSESAGATAPEADHPGLFVQPGTPLDLHELSGERRRVSFKDDELSFEGWLLESSLASTYDLGANEEPANNALTRDGVSIVASPGGKALAKLSMPAGKQQGFSRPILTTGPAVSGYSPILFTSHSCTIRGFLRSQDVQTGSGASSAFRAFGHGSGWGSSAPKITLPAGTNLVASPGGPVIGKILTEQTVELTARAKGFVQVALHFVYWTDIPAWVESAP